MRLYRFFQGFFSILLFLLGLVLGVVEFTNYFIAPLYPLFENPGAGNMAYLFRFIGAAVFVATGLFGAIRGKGVIHLMLSFACIGVASFLFFSMEWYIALAFLILSVMVTLLNILMNMKGWLFRDK